MRQNAVRDAATLVRDPDDDMLRRLAYKNLNGWWFGSAVFSNDCLYRVPDEFSDNVLQMAFNIGEGSIKMALDADVGNLNMGAVCSLDQFLGGLAAALNNFLCVAFQEDFADGVVVRIEFGLIVGEVPGRVEGVGQCQMLLCDDTA